MDYDNGFILQKAVNWSLPRFNHMNQRSTAKGIVKFLFEFGNCEVLIFKGNKIINIKRRLSCNPDFNRFFRRFYEKK